MLQFGPSLTDDTSNVNYDRNMFIIQVTSLVSCEKFIYSSVPGLPLVNPELPDSSSDDSSSSVSEDSLVTVSELEDDRLLCLVTARYSCKMKQLNLHLKYVIL